MTTGRKTKVSTLHPARASPCESVAPGSIMHYIATSVDTVVIRVVLPAAYLIHLRRKPRGQKDPPPAMTGK